MSIKRHRAEGNTDAILDAASVPEHLRPGGQCWPVVCGTRAINCLLCGGTGRLELTNGRVTDCDCHSGQEWVTHYQTTDEPVDIYGVEVHALAGSEVAWMPVFAGLLTLFRYNFTVDMLKATREEAQAECDRLNEEAA